MPLLHRLILWFALLGMVMHAPLPTPEHAQAAGQLAELGGFCGASGQRLAGLIEHVPLGQDHPGGSHSADHHLCCLFCTHPNNTGAVAGTPAVYPPRFALLAIIRQGEATVYRFQIIPGGMARAPPLA